jgi:hypothetical protein
LAVQQPPDDVEIHNTGVVVFNDQPPATDRGREAVGDWLRGATLAEMSLLKMPVRWRGEGGKAPGTLRLRKNQECG